MVKRLRGRLARPATAMTAVLGMAATIAAGCGSGAGGGGSATTAARTTTSARTTTATTPATGATESFRHERAVFRVNCGACHTLADARTHGTRAGGEANLDPIRPNVASVKNFVSHGFGKMPSFRDRLSAREIDALARYVATVDGCGTASPTSCTGQP